MTLKEKLKKGPVFGITCYTGMASVVECIGRWGYDFVYLDLEHATIDGLCNIERLILAAKHAGVSPLVRVSGVHDSEIRQVLEMGAEGVVVPHCRTKEDVEKIVFNAKFPPRGRRGGESNVRAAGFGVNGFSWSEYTQKSNEDTMIIPMDEDFEFTDNIEEILSVEDVDAVNFGPIDYALSVGAQVGYKITDDRVDYGYKRLREVAQKKGVAIMAPVVPSTEADLKAAIDRGINMLILGNDMYYVNQGIGSVIKEVNKVRK
ncbi:MAG: 2,4-dihydroxyhept-2-ene-1,7-dioic acid aldolase [Sphaerochaetaceae bacterium]|nr:2,4-dihydroxyhept-2-ene-1,7-dioic acid aldolase [Sphaerochaetaceae bacterium]